MIHLLHFEQVDRNEGIKKNITLFRTQVENSPLLKQMNFKKLKKDETTTLKLFSRKTNNNITIKLETKKNHVFIQPNKQEKGKENETKKYEGRDRISTKRVQNFKKKIIEGGSTSIIYTLK